MNGRAESALAMSANHLSVGQS